MSYRMFDYGAKCELLARMLFPSWANAANCWAVKALLVTDKGLRAIKDGAVDKTLEHLREAGIDVVVFDGVEPNPKDTNVRDGRTFS